MFYSQRREALLKVIGLEVGRFYVALHYVGVKNSGALVFVGLILFRHMPPADLAPFQLGSHSTRLVDLAPCAIWLSLVVSSPR